MIQTAALQMIPGIKPEHCRTPEIMADAAYQVLIADAKTTTGNFFIDDEVLERGRHYRPGPVFGRSRKSAVAPDLFL